MGGIDHLLFATDFPYLPLTGTKPFLENSPLSEAGKEKLAHLNPHGTVALEMKSEYKSF